MNFTSSFTEPSVVENWSWNGQTKGEFVMPPETARNLVEDDTSTILFRTIARNNKQAKSAQQAKMQPAKKPSKGTTILPAPLHKMTVSQLQTTLKSLGIKTSGARQDLIERLEHFLKSED